MSPAEGHNTTATTATTTETSPMLGNATPPVVVTGVTDDDKVDVNNKHTLLLQPLCFDPATVETGNGSTSSGCCFFFRRDKAVSGGNHRQRTRRHKTAFHQVKLRHIFDHAYGFTSRLHIRFPQCNAFWKYLACFAFNQGKYSENALQCEIGCGSSTLG